MNCQLRYLDGIGEKNTWFNDKLQYFMRKYRYYKKRILVSLRLRNIRHDNSQLNQDEIKPGDIVRIRSKPEIKQTLDWYGKIRGCSFLKNQYSFCGEKHKVFKRVDYFFDESRQKMLKSSNLFFLEDVYCNGNSAYLKPCDRNCFHYWHKNWLEKT
jgi:hypothetical protein